MNTRAKYTLTEDKALTDFAGCCLWRDVPTYRQQDVDFGRGPSSNRSLVAEHEVMVLVIVWCLFQREGEEEAVAIALAR